MRVSVRVIDKHGVSMLLHLVDWEWFCTQGFLPAHQGLCVRLGGDLICYVNNEAGSIPLLTLRDFHMPTTPSDYGAGWQLVGDTVGFGFVHRAGSLPPDSSPERSPLVSSEVWWGILEINGDALNTQFNMAFLWGQVVQQQHELKVPLTAGAAPLSSESIIRPPRL